MPEQGVNFTRPAARRISDVVREVEGQPRPEPVLQRHRAGGLGRSTLWEVTAVNPSEDPPNCTIRRVENQDGDLITASQKEDILYDLDDPPKVGDRGLLVRFGEGKLVFFKGALGGTAMIKIMSGGPGDTYTANVYGNGKNQSITEVGATIKVLQIASTETIPVNTWLVATRQKWGPAETEQIYWTIEVARDY